LPASSACRPHLHGLLPGVRWIARVGRIDGYIDAGLAAFDMSGLLSRPTTQDK